LEIGNSGENLFAADKCRVAKAQRKTILYSQNN